jgi:hypothetical protein
MPHLRPTFVAKRLGLAYAAGIAWLAFGDVGNDPMLLLSGPFVWAWLTGPAALAAMLVKAARTRPGGWLFVLVEASVVASTIWFLVETTVHCSAWTSVGFSMTLGIVGPIYQYAGVGIAFAAASLLGWRARRSGSRPEAGKLTAGRSCRRGRREGRPGSRGRRCRRRRHGPRRP